MTIGDTAHFEIGPEDWFTSDPHFGHTNVIAYCGRPYCCKHSMNENLIQAWNHAVKPNDRVFVLGDFFFGSPGFAKRIISRLNGHLILIKGNHDRGRTKMVEYGFKEAYTNATATFEYEGKQLNIWMRHIPDYDHHDKYDIHLCGHVHEKFTKIGNVINVGTDVWDYSPQKLKFILDNADKKQAAMKVAPLTDVVEAKTERDDKLIKDMYERDK